MAFLKERHRALAERTRRFGEKVLRPIEGEEEGVHELTRRILRELGKAGLAACAVSAPYGGGSELLEARSLCVIREQLARRMALADFAFAMQGLGSYPIALAGSEEQKRRILPKIASGELAGAFAITEAEAGSDVGSIQCSARLVGDEWIINGRKRFISNATIFGAMTLFARSDPEAGRGKGISAFLLEADTPGLRVVEQFPMSPHPMGELIFEDARLPKSALLGVEGIGMRLAMATLDVFRSTVGAAAVGMAQRAHEEAIAYVKKRQQFGGPLAKKQGVQFFLAESQAELDAARLLVQRAAWAKDKGQADVSQEAAVAKLVATENAQRIIDRSLQLHGGNGVMKGSVTERLYREIRALRIYEGTSEIQKLVIARKILAD